MGFFFDREKAEQTIWNRLKHLTALKKRRQKHKTSLKIGVLGNYYNVSSLFCSTTEKKAVWSVNVHAQGSTERNFYPELSPEFYPGDMLEI